MFSRKNKDKGPQTPTVLNEMPVVPNRVLYVGVPIFNDPDCRNQDCKGTIIITEPLDPNDQLHEFDVMPTSLKYEVGQLVHFRTNQHKMWDAAWFHNPISGKVEKAWRTAAAEFTGELIPDELVEKHRENVSELEERLRERHPHSLSGRPPQPVN